MVTCNLLISVSCAISCCWVSQLICGSVKGWSVGQLVVWSVVLGGLASRKFSHLLGGSAGQPVNQSVPLLVNEFVLLHP
jgi:hypothetical protein